MRRRQPLGDLSADPQHFGHVQRTAAVEFLLKRFAGDELHRQEGERLFADLVDLHHILVPNLGRRPSFAQEPFAGGGQGRNLRGHHLDRDDALQGLVEGAKDDAEAPLSEHLEHFVMPQPAERVGPGGRRQEVQAVRFFVRHGAGLGSGIDCQRVVAIGVGYHGRGRAEKSAGRVMGAEQRLDPIAQPGIAPASLVQVCGPGGLVGLFGCFEEDLFHSIRVGRHGALRVGVHPSMRETARFVSPKPEKSS